MSVDAAEVLVNSQTITYFHASALSIALFDWLLTFGDEYTFIWKSRWNLGKILFLLTRYPTFVDTALSQYYQLANSLSARQCSHLHTTTGWLQLSGIVIAEIILVIRVWALWGREYCIGFLLVGIAIAELAAAVVLFTQFHSSQQYIPISSLVPGLPGCYRIFGNNRLYLDFLLLVIYETLLVILTLMKAMQHFREGTSSFSFTFFRDGFVYFAILLVVSLVNVVILFTESNESNMLTLLQRVLHSVFSARIILNLRQKSAETRMVTPEDLGTPFRSNSFDGDDTQSVIAFTVPDGGNTTRHRFSLTV